MTLYDISTLLSDIPLVRDLNFPGRDITTLLTDSRSLTDPESSLFFALRTRRADGHAYISSLYNAGVRAFVVEDASMADRFPDADFIEVISTSEALLATGAAARHASPAQVIGITGSRGKTMVKEWLYLLLRDDFRISRSPRSYNSQIGVPLSLWQFSSDTTLGIVEAGISATGEMARLQGAISPDIVVLTSIGNEHAEGFDCIESKIEEKLLLAAQAGTLIYPAADPIIAKAVEKAKRDAVIPFNIQLIDSSRFLPQVIPAEFPALTQPWERENAATCMAVMHVLRYDHDTIMRRMHRLTPMGTRLKVTEGVNNCLLITDDYLCDLHSLAPALDFMKRRATPDRTNTLIIADLDHEASTAAETYSGLARLCRERSIDTLIGIGEEISAHAELFAGISDTRFFTDRKQAADTLTPTDFSDSLILIKGAPGAPFSELSRMLEARTHETVLEVNLDALVDNYNFYRSRLKPSTGIVAMVKADGYGAGSYELAKTLQSAGAAYLAVAVLDEGVALRRAGITMPIMVLNPKVLNYRELFAHSLEPEIFSFGILEEIIEQARRAGVTDYPVHIKLDTGMHRLGFTGEDIPELISRLRQQNRVKVASVFSHLATADCPDMNDYTLMQLDCFTRWSASIADAFPYKVKRHVLNTAGIIRFPEYQFDMVRLGIGLYGVPVLRDGSESALRQVSTLRTVIISIKEWPEGTTIGYGRRGVLIRPSRIATIPIGYADGINRHMGRGTVSFLVNGHPCPTVGNICMDICMIDITDAPGTDGTPGSHPAVGDSVVVFSPENPVTPMADALDTIPYELLTSVSPRVRRIYYTE